MKLSVVILNYNVRYFLELCIRSVQEALTDIDSEIIVIDNNSDDDSCLMVKEEFPEIKLIENSKNLGFSKANNQGVKTARGEYVCILNPDTVVAEDTFSKLIEFADKKKNLGIIGCRLIDGSGGFLPESKRNIPVVKVALQKMFGKSKHYYANAINEYDINKVAILVGAFMFLKRETYNFLGGFDKDYFMYGEDIDLSYKSLKYGLDNYYFGKTTIIHFKGESTLKDVTYAKRFYNAMQIFYRKHFKSNLIFDTLVWLGIKMAFLLRKEPKSEHYSKKRWLAFSDKLKNEIIALTNEKVDLILKKNLKNERGTVVYSTKENTFKEIIESITKSHSNENLKHRIMVSESNFIIGSDSSIGRGEVVK